jgi:hypothetical protein
MQQSLHWCAHGASGSCATRLSRLAERQLPAVTPEDRKHSTESPLRLQVTSLVHAVDGHKGLHGAGHLQCTLGIHHMHSAAASIDQLQHPSLSTLHSTPSLDIPPAHTPCTHDTKQHMHCGAHSHPAAGSATPHMGWLSNQIPDLPTAGGCTCHLQVPPRCHLSSWLA